MLNELYTLERSLDHFKVKVEKSHPWVKRLGRGDVLIAGIDATGVVTRVEHRAKEDAVTLFKIQQSNHSNFPQVNWSAPLWEPDTNSASFRDWQACPAADSARRIALLRAAIVHAGITAEQAYMLTRLREFCRELRPRFPMMADSEFAAFPVLIDRILTEGVGAEGWTRSLSNAMLASAEEGTVPLAAVETLLAGDPAKKDRKCKVAILFDLADCTKFQRRVASPQMGGYFSQRLNDTESSGTSRGRCALSGLEMALESGKLPSPRLPVLGDTVLMSMNPDTPCQTRYGHIGTDIFPLGTSTSKALNAALLHLTAADREGRNWKRVPGSSGKKPNLLLVYLESSPDFEAQIAELFTGGDESGAMYETLCSAVCEALRGRAASESDLLHLFVLNKIDPGRVQVELSEAFTAAQVIQGSAEWATGANNRPLLPLKVDDFFVSPEEVMRCLPGCRLADLYDVLIGGTSNATHAATLLLRLTLDRASDLFMAIGHAAHRGNKEAWKGIGREGARNAVIAASVLGISLTKLGHRKETYMQEPAFLIGRFLSLTDTLHAEYCKEVRKGDMPPQLLGNALMPTAIGDPNRGFARMSNRLRPYHAWARTRGSGLARWACAEMGKIASEIAGNLGNLRLSEAQQAQVLLGYLARAEKASEEGAQE